MPSRFRSVLPALLLGAVMLAAPLATLACCPSDGNGRPKMASNGLGENYPAATDLAVDATWKVYEFERDGIRYVQANDGAGNVRAAVGRIGETLWVLPIGTDADRVSVPGNSTQLPVGVSARLVYSTDAIAVWVYQTASGDWWAVRPASSR